MIEYLISIDKGERSNNTCCGYPTFNSHDETEYVIGVGIHWWSHHCPICGFGSGGSLSGEEYRKWVEYKNPSLTRRMMNYENNEVP